jgi:hypothetical protein
VDKFYDEQLEQLGWRRYRIRKSWAFIESREYCKGKIDVAVELRDGKPEGQNFILDVTVYWSKADENNCESNNQ